MLGVYQSLVRIALVEFGDIVAGDSYVGGTPASPNKLRLTFTDGSFLDVWLSTDGDYAYHWEQRPGDCREPSEQYLRDCALLRARFYPAAPESITRRASPIELALHASR